MYDINKFIADEKLGQNDPSGHVAELTRWSPMVANRIAEEEGLALEDDHWQVIYCLRERFRVLGPEWSARQMTQELAHEFADAGGLRRLYELFPHGPLVQACLLAGLPLPHGTVNDSFGSVH
jgi:tRNA 2-thiouridine synthesizing protein E